VSLDIFWFLPMDGDSGYLGGSNSAEGVGAAYIVTDCRPYMSAQMLITDKTLCDILQNN
jgi:hypothetical protein